MKKQIFLAAASIAVVAAMSVSASAVDAGATNGSDQVEVQLEADKPVKLIPDDIEGVVIEAAAGVFGNAGNLVVRIDVEQVNAEEVEEVEEAVAKAATAGTVKTSDGKAAKIELKSIEAVVDIEALVDGIVTQPDGSVAITVAKVPGQTSNCAIYLNDDGSIEILPTEVTETTLTFTTKHFSEFYLVTAVVEDNSDVSGGDDNNGGNGSTDGSNTPDKNLPTGVVLAVVPAIAAAAAIVVSKKRK